MTDADSLIDLRRDSLDEEPEHRNDRRRFLIWALMLGAVPPERVVERIVDELEQDASR
jgi:hypothetical protein